MAEAKFLSGDLMKHVATMAFTSSAGLLVLFGVDLVDMVFISMLGDPALVAAIGFASTILFFTTAISIGFSIATSALVSRSLGAGEQERGRLYATNVLSLGIAFACLFSLVIWVFTPNLLSLLGARDAVLGHATSYLRIIVPSMPFMICGMAVGGVVRAHGDMSRATAVSITAGLVNAVLDPIFIFALGWGLEGAAAASVGARVTLAVLNLWLVFGRYGGLPTPRLDLFRQDLPRVFGIAGPAILTNIATPIGSAFVTRSMASFGDEAVAGMSIIGRLTPVAFAVLFALSGAVGPIVGQNFGGGRLDRVRGALVAAAKFAFLYTVGVTAFLFLTRGLIADAFQATGEARSLIYLFCGPLALSFVFNGLLFCANASFNNLNRPLVSTTMNWGRNTLGVVPFVIIGASVAGPAGVLIGQAAGGVIFGSAAIFWALKLSKDLEAGRASTEGAKLNLNWRRPLAAFTNNRG